MLKTGILTADLKNALRCSEIETDSSIFKPGSKYRNKFMSDRDKIMYCKAFLRLSGKTQVYTPSSGDDHHRTRLTHTLEVSQIARTIILKSMKIRLQNLKNQHLKISLRKLWL